MNLGNSEYQVVPLDGPAHSRYVRLLTAWAKEIDEPLIRFCSKLTGLPPEDRSAAIQGFMCRPDWDAPPELLMRSVGASRRGVAVLAHEALRPTPSLDELTVMITDENYSEIYSELLKGCSNQTRPMTNEEILEFNKQMRERIKDDGNTI